MYLGTRVRTYRVPGRVGIAAAAIHRNRRLRVCKPNYRMPRASNRGDELFVTTKRTPTDNRLRLSRVMLDRSTTFNNWRWFRL